MHPKELFRRVIVSILTLEAKAVLRKYRPKIIAVTGSVGKTSAKDAIYTALSDSFFVRKSEKSFNGDIGVPLTVLGVPNGWSNAFQWLKNLMDGASLLFLTVPYPEWLVLEVGADRPGDITRSLSWLTPDIVVATRFPDISVHVEFYASPQDLIREELAPASWLKPGGAFVFNHDDEKAKEALTPPEVRRISFGFGEGAEVRATRFRLASAGKMPAGLSFDVTYGSEKTHIVISGVVGRSHAYAVLAGLASAAAVGVPLSAAAEAFEGHEAPPGRARLIPGARESMIIDDTYNSSPVAAEEALATLSEIPRKGRRIAVLADMLELGVFSVDEHKRVGGLVPLSADLLVTVGVRARNIAEAAREAGMDAEKVVECDKAADAAAILAREVGEGDVILVKGSQSMRMERVVKTLMAEPHRAKELLVRQDEEWRAR